MTRVNAGQITYEAPNPDDNSTTFTQKLDVFHYKDGRVRVVRRGGLPGVQGDTLVFENGNFTKLPTHLYAEFHIVGEDEILKQI